MTPDEIRAALHGRFPDSRFTIAIDGDLAMIRYSGPDSYAIVETSCYWLIAGPFSLLRMGSIPKDAWCAR